MTYDESKQAIKDAVRQFPETFGLAAFPGELFRVSEQASYTENGVVYVYTQRLMFNSDGCKQWRDFAKGTVSEIKAQINTPMPTLLEQAIALHKTAPGTWIKTDQDITVILMTLPSIDRHQPLDGGLWWRTHHLVRQLGGVA
jgi:hypothetical protein